MTLEGVGLDVIGLPLLAGVLVIATHVPLGREVLRRGIIFIDLAVAQIAGLGVIAAGMMGAGIAGWQAQLVAVASALLGAVLIRGYERFWPDSQEALIGITFVLAATGDLLLLAGSPHAAKHVTDLLTGQLLWISAGQLETVALIYFPVLVLWYWLGPGRLRFYLLFAVTVTASVQLVGVYLVFASLIIPALAVRGLPGLPGVVAGSLLGILAYAAGLAISLWFDWPAGPAVVWVLAVLAVLFAAGRAVRSGR